MNEIECKLLKPFGSTIAQSSMPKELIDDFTKDLTKIRTSPELKKNHYFGERLVGQIHSEYLISPDIMLKWKQNYFDHIIRHYCLSHYKNSTIKSILVTAAWHNVQKQADYNPCHTHTRFTHSQNPHISTVGYIKLPKKMVDYKHSKEHSNVNGYIEFTEGTEDIFTNSNYLIPPKLGTFYVFPATLRHCVYPFYCEDENDERISFSFNAKIIFDEKTS